MIPSSCSISLTLLPLLFASATASTLNSRGYVLLLAIALLPYLEFYLFSVSIPVGQGQVGTGSIMTSGYSRDLRERVIGLREKGETQARIAEVLGMSISTVKRYLVRYAQTGSVAATVQGRMKPRLGEAELRIVEAQLEAHADATLQMHAAWFGEQTGMVVSGVCISRAIRRLGWTRKKRRWVRASGTR